MERLKVYLYENQELIYLIQYMIFSIVLIGVVYVIDYRWADINLNLPDFFTVSVDLSSQILSTLAGALLTITTFTFTSILTVLSLQVANYSNAIIENFLKEPIIFKVLGVFLGGFLFCISSLALTRDFNENQQVISGMIAILYALVCVIYFIRFVRTTTQFSQDTTIIVDIYHETRQAIEEELEERTDESPEVPKEGEEERISIYATDSGYFSVVDSAALLDVFEEKNCQLEILHQRGNFIAQEDEMARLYFFDSKIDSEELDVEKIENSFIFSETKISKNDYRQGLNKLLEICLRGLGSSAPDNDMSTLAVHKLALLLGQLGSSSLNHRCERPSEELAIFYHSYNFYDDLFNIVVQIVNQGLDDFKVMQELLYGLVIIYRQSSSTNRPAVQKVAAYLQDKLKDTYHHSQETASFKNWFSVILPEEDAAE